MYHFLLIDDNPGDRTLISRQLQLEFPDAQMQIITSQPEFDQALATGSFDLVITDFLLHWSDGLTILQAVKLFYPHCPVIMFTGSGSQETAVEAMKSGLDDYLVKSPNHYVRIPVAVRTALQRTAERNYARQVTTQYYAAQDQVVELERLNQLKDDFLNMVSHELRTPITNMKLALKLLRSAVTEDQRERYIKILEVECDREADLINNLLDLQRLEAAACSATNPELAFLQDWIPSLIDGFQGRLQTRRQQIDIELPDLPAVKLDHTELKRVLAELINNACKYTAADGTIRLAMTLEPPVAAASARDRGLTITIQNQAEIPAAALPHIFDKFYRVPKADHWGQGGTGLGLALVQQLVTRMNGAIAVTSQNGWTTFTLQFRDV
ncbi:MAG: hybrid sensor histidine kinase/response regulator [Leptolyngbyaceae cyanobacterium bins.349]|nr:hybrid sensor histidine kinase/response regulator [Leptolyngbyaceae cyanobacterium bins.349]